MGNIKSKINKIRRVVNFDYNITKDNMESIILKVNELEKNIDHYNQNVDMLFSDIINRISEMEYNYKQELIRIKKQLNYVNLETLQLPIFRDTAKKKVLICGFYGAVNLGDDLMLETLLKYISTDDFDITIMLCDNQNVDVTKYGKQYNFIHFPILSTDFNIYANYYDCLIFGGGALIDDYLYDDNNIEQYTLGKILIELTTSFIKYGKKTYLYGLSSNKKIDNQDFINKLQFIINNTTHFSVRDTYSKELFAKLGLNVSKVKIVDDIIFANDFKTIKKEKNESLNVGIIYICNEENYNQIIKYTKKIIKYLDNNYKNKYNIRLIPFYNYMRNDEIIYERMLAELKCKNIKIENMAQNLNELINILNKNDYIISMRYHGTLISNILDKNVLNIVLKQHGHYENKMKYLYEKYQFKKLEINFGETLKQTLLDNLFENDITNSIIDIDKLKQQSKHDICTVVNNMKK